MGLFLRYDSFLSPHNSLSDDRYCYLYRAMLPVGKLQDDFLHTKNGLGNKSSCSFWNKELYEYRRSMRKINQKIPLFESLIVYSTRKNKNSLMGVFRFFWRRDRDSNSGYLAARQFSRLLQSTTLPSLRMCGRGSIGK